MRPKFGWDTRTTPWTHDRESQEGYARAVKLWGQFHDMLPDTNSNKITSDLRGICLNSQLYGRDYDLCYTLSDADIMDDDRASKIVAAIYVRDLVAVKREVYSDFNQLLSVNRGPSESYQSYENKISAQVAKISAHGKELAIHESLLAMMLLSGINVDDAQRIPILFSARSSDAIEATDTVASIVTQNTYGKVASILRQCQATSLKSYSTEIYIASYANDSFISQQAYGSGRLVNSGKGNVRNGGNQMAPTNIVSIR